jgi:hypothetical protein
MYKMWSTKYVRLNPRLYELFSILFVSAGLNILANAVAPQPLVGTLLTLSGIALFFAAAIVSKYFDIGRRQRETSKESLARQMNKGVNADEALPALPSIARLAETAALSRPDRQQRWEFNIVGLALLLAFGAAFMLLLSQPPRRLSANPPQAIPNSLNQNIEALVREVRTQHDEIRLLRGEVAAMQKHVDEERQSTKEGLHGSLPAKRRAGSPR